MRRSRCCACWIRARPKRSISYLDYLGYQIDWEHRFNEGNPASPLYMQISLGGSQLHLNGHADASAPVTEVRVPVAGLDAFCGQLQAKAGDRERPEVVDPRYEGRNTDMNLTDPSGNLLVFWTPTSLHNS